MQVVTTPSEFYHSIGNTQYIGCGFVPTMGALHEGHLSLIRAAGGLARPVVVSVFVNPTQFGPDEDYQRYPRTLEADCTAAGQAGADIVFTPGVDTVYPPGEVVPVPALPAVATRPGLEDARRPTHFAGVCQVVARLFDIVRPRIAVFGEKDYQQLLVIKAMVEQERGRWGDLRIVSQPTVREPDGMAMSSRNRYLTPAQRERGRGLSRALQAAAGSSDWQEAEGGMRRVLSEHELEIEYAVVRDAETLLPIRNVRRPARALIAARVDEIRLIDNEPVTLADVEAA
jgi:pantoate--beta-alanine ligase